MRIDQVLPSLASRDAIGVHTRNLKAALEARGIESRIFYGNCTPDVADLGESVIGLTAPVPDRVVLYHASIGSPVFDTLTLVSDPIMVDYHNITPTKLLDSWEPSVAHELSLGRRQLAELAPRCVLGLADSAYNERELIDLGYSPTAVAPLLIDMRHSGEETDAGYLDRLLAAKEASGSRAIPCGVRPIAASAACRRASCVGSTGPAAAATSSSIDATPRSPKTNRSIAIGSRAASTAARSLIAGKDPTQALENLGLKTLVNEGVGVAKDYASEFGKTLGFGSDTPADPNAAAPAEKADAIPTDVRDLIPTSTEVASPTSGAPTGGLAAVSSPDVTTADNATTAATLGQSGLGAMAPAASATDVGAIARAGASLAPPPDVTSEEPAPAGAPSAPPELPQQPAQPEAPQKNLFQQAAPLSPLGIMGAGVNKYLTGEVNQALRPTPQRPAAASGLKSAAPSRLTPEQMAQMRAGVSAPTPAASAPAAPRQAPQFGPPKKANVANMTPITNVASLMKILGKKG